MKFTGVLLRHRIPYKVSHSNTAEIKICCPFCEERRGERDTIFCLSINVISGAGHCFHAKCDWGSKSHAVSTILRLLKEPGVIDGSMEEAPEAEPIHLPKDFQLLTKAYDDLDRKALNYVLRRNITNDQIRSKKIGVSYLGRYAYRIVFPVYFQKELKGIVARDFVGREPRYLNSPGIKSFYNLPANPVRCVYLTEGIFKALRLEGIILPLMSNTASLAILGHSVTEEQITQLEACKATDVIIIPDPDQVGRQGAVRVAEKLIEHFNRKVQVSMVWPVTKPIDEMTEVEIRCTLAQGNQYFNQGVRNRVWQGMV